MSAPAANYGTVRFDAFEADLRTGELRKDGIKVKLDGQPFQVLAALVERPGQLVTREELQKELWPDETFVDFEQGINAAVKRLRLALDCRWQAPRRIASGLAHSVQPWGLRYRRAACGVPYHHVDAAC